MLKDHYLESFHLLDLYVHERSVNEAFSELGGIARELPLLDNTIIESCHISHYLSNDLEQKWIRALHVECTSSLPALAIHNRFRDMANEDLSITFAGDDETVLCTGFSHEVLKAQAFGGSGPTKVFLSSQLSGFDANEASTFLANPLDDLVPHKDLTIRLVSARSSRAAVEENLTDRELEQRWTVADVNSAMQKLVAAADGNRWIVEQNLNMTEAGLAARLRHAPSADVIHLSAATGYGKPELRAICR